MKKLILATAMIALAIQIPAHANSGHKHTQPTAHSTDAAPTPTGNATADITAKLKAIFETQDRPLTVEPVVSAGDWAIAGWTQGGKGGRALLKRKGEGWSIHLCSGDSLKDAAVLQKIGVPEGDAGHLAHHLAEAEASLAPETLALFASFEGTVLVEGAEDGTGHTEGHGHQGHGAHKP